jgi:hypothetical protein
MLVPSLVAHLLASGKTYAYTHLEHAGVVAVRAGRSVQHFSPCWVIIHALSWLGLQRARRRRNLRNFTRTKMDGCPGFHWNKLLETISHCMTYVVSSS